MRFFGRELEGLMDVARAELAAFVGSAPENLVFVPNASTGVSTVLRSLALSAGDELLCTSQGYNACRNALEVVAARAGARVVQVDLPFPVLSPSDVVDAVLEKISPRTRLLLIDHVTSITGMRLPVEALVPQVQKLGVEVLVDGAHAPGMLELKLEALGADYYTGNCHKWMCTPKGSALLHVAPRHQGKILPLTVGHGHNAARTDKSRFQLEFALMATADPSAFLSVPAALQFVRDEVPGGWAGMRATNHARVRDARRRLLSELGATPVCPEEMLGALATVTLPPEVAPGESAGQLMARLFEQNRIEVPVWPFPAAPSRALRISAQVYNPPEDYEQLLQALH